MTGTKLVVVTLGSIAISVTVIVTVGFEYLVDQPWLVYKNSPFPVTGTIFRPGDTVPATVERCNISGERRSYTMARSIVDVATGTPYTLPDLTTELAPGCVGKTGKSLAHKVPKMVGNNVFPPGTYKIIGLVPIKGFMQTHYVSWATQQFIVEARP